MRPVEDNVPSPWPVPAAEARSTQDAVRACRLATVSQQGDSPQAPRALPPTLLQGVALVAGGPEPAEFALAPLLVPTTL